MRSHRRHPPALTRTAAWVMCCLILPVALALPGCAGNQPPHPQTQPRIRSGGVGFVPAPKGVRRTCLATARAVGYPVPCPREVPAFLTSVSKALLTATIIGAAKGPSWKGWVVGSSFGPNMQQHLVITASPSPTSAVKLVNGPGWYPKARVQVLGAVVISGLTREIVFVPMDTNDGSIFAHHVVLVWTVGNHTYGLGFHVLTTRREALALDEKLAGVTTLVSP